MATLKALLQELEVTSASATAAGRGINFFADDMQVATLNNIQFDDVLTYVQEHISWNARISSTRFITISEPANRTSLAELFEEEKAPVKGKKTTV